MVCLVRHYDPVEGHKVVSLSPVPTDVEYPDRRLYKSRATKDGGTVIQRPMRDSRPRQWVWLGYQRRQDQTFHAMWRLLESLEAKARWGRGLVDTTVEIWEDADTDKTKRETLVPISGHVRAAIDRVITGRPGLGSVPLFPAPGNRDVPMSRHLADKWLREGERLAKLDPLKGGLWHPYRRKWATERKHLPDKDVAASGGWKSTLTLKLYQQPDEATMLHVVLGGGELRAANEFSAHMHTNMHTP